MRHPDWKRRRQHFVKSLQPAYNELKATWCATIAAYAKRQHLPGLARAWEYPVAMSWRYYERDAHRDPDGIAAGARKLISDALTSCTARCARGCNQHAGVLPTDGHRHVGRTVWEHFYIGFETASGTVVEGVTVGFYQGERCVAVLAVPALLPDFNELQAARELGARRMQRAVQP